MLLNYIINICFINYYYLFNLRDYIKNLLSSNDLLQRFLLTLHLMIIKNNCDITTVAIQAKM